MGRHTGIIDISAPTKGKVLWKYLDLHRFVYLLSKKSLFFTRLDKFNDPFEGVATKLLRQDSFYGKIPSSIGDFPKSMSRKEKNQLLNEKKLHDFIRKDNIEKAQSRQYVSCWHCSDRESMAMWNLYSNLDSVALKVDFDRLSKGLINPFRNFVHLQGNRISVVGASISYLPLNPFDPTLKKQKIKYSALKKDLSFEYEKEYRFLIIAMDGQDKAAACYSVPVNLGDLYLTVVAHPNIGPWKYENLQNLVQMLEPGIKVERSPIILRS